MPESAVLLDPVRHSCTYRLVAMQELIEDLQEECGKHGTVVDTRIPRPPDGSVGQGCFGKVYVLMDSAESASGIQKTFNGRMYDGRSLVVQYIQPAHFYMLPFHM